MKTTIESEQTPALVQGYDNTRFKSYCANLTEEIPQNRKILFVQIPQVILDAFNKGIALNRGYYIFPPTGLQFIYDSIKHRDVEVEILDLNYEILRRVHEDDNFDPLSWPEILSERMKEFQPSIVGVSCLFDVGITPMLQTLRAIRAEGNAITVGGGVIATYEWQTLLGDDLCHFVVRGEGENKFNYLLDQLLNETGETQDVPGIYFNDGEYCESQGAPDVVEIRSNLIDSYDLVPIEDYYKFGSLNPFSRMDHVDKAPFAAIQLCRGCRAQCTFCAVRDFMGKGVRFRDVKNTIEEMEFLIEEKGVRHFELLDDDPTFYRHEFKAVLKTIIDRGWDIRWSANNGVIAATVDEEMLALMRDSGCIGFKVGIETGNPDMLRKVKKPAKHNKFLNLSRMLEGYPEIFVGGNFIVGLPEESFYMMMDSFKFILEVNLDWAAITVCQVIRGASAFSDAGEYFETQMKEDGVNVTNFIPSRNSRDGKIDAEAGVLQGLAVFLHDPEATPSASQVKEVWFTFNMIGNYIFNKNLKPHGRPDKFISWVKNAQKAYPTNPNMHLFMGLAYVIKGDLETAMEMRDKAIEFGSGDYWQERFSQFNLLDLLNDFPETPEQVFSTLHKLQQETQVHFQDWLDIEYGLVPPTKDVS
jgi:radical SAM superfamily enzyme YgiQ (UPF0313 family)